MIHEVDENQIHIEVSVIVSLSGEYFNRDEWERVKKMSRDEIIDLMEFESIDLNTRVFENVHHNLGQI